MARYVYPAVFSPEKGGGYSVFFKDIEGCYACGDSLEDAIFMAEDALGLMLWHLEEEGKEIPSPSKAESIKLKKVEFVNFIKADTIEYAKKVSNRAVKKTLSIPEWLNIKAEAAGVNFSQVLQDALKEKLELV